MADLTSNSPPSPHANERPAAFADRVGRWYAATIPAERKKRCGQYPTPVEVADFMATLFCARAPALRALDPGAGAGVLSCALGEALAASSSLKPLELQLEAYETDVQLAAYLEICLSYAQQWLRPRGVALSYEVRHEDFVLQRAASLTGLPNLFAFDQRAQRNFDLVISNPPYFKLPKSDPRAQAAATVVHGQPNIYALFMAVSAALLKPGGQMVCIVPRSFAAGPYFRLFRERFFALMQPQMIHLFGSRREAFRRDEVLQENIILLAERADDWAQRAPDGGIELSLSAGARDLSKRQKRRVALSEVLDLRSQDRVLRIPVRAADGEIVRAVRSWTGSLRAYGLDISTGPVVPFRATKLLRQNGAATETCAPLLWMQNVAPMRIAWPAQARGKAQRIVVNEASLPLLVSNRNYVLLRRFSAKEARRRLIAAPFLASEMDAPLIGLENHLNYAHRPGGSLSAEEAYGLAALFNSALLDSYFRISNGNTQVSATEIRALPLPPLEVITEIGKQMLACGRELEEIDELIARACLPDGYFAPTSQPSDV